MVSEATLRLAKLLRVVNTFFKEHLYGRETCPRAEGRGCGCGTKPLDFTGMDQKREAALCAAWAKGNGGASGVEAACGAGTQRWGGADMNYRIIPFMRVRFEDDWQQKQSDGGIVAYYPGTGACIVEVEPAGDSSDRLNRVISTWSIGRSCWHDLDCGTGCPLTRRAE